MQDFINKKVFPGFKICKYSGQKLGYGLYLNQNSIFSSAIGIIQASTVNGCQVYSVKNNLPNKRAGISVGDIVYGRVIKVKQQECIVQILQINKITYIVQKNVRSLEGSIRKQNVREKMVDSVVMIQCFKPRDIVKAKVISLGDSTRGVYLSTAAEDLGVLVAQHEETGRLMLPFDWATMVDPEQLVKQSRKVCKPQ